MAPHEKTELRGMSIQNAFQAVRPRGADAPAKLPVQRKKKAVPITYSNKRVLNVNGKLQASLNPNASNSIVIESREQSQASNDKQRAIARGMS